MLFVPPGTVTCQVVQLPAGSRSCSLCPLQPHLQCLQVASLLLQGKYSCCFCGKDLSTPNLPLLLAHSGPGVQKFFLEPNCRYADCPAAQRQLLAFEHWKPAVLPEPGSDVCRCGAGLCWELHPWELQGQCPCGGAAMACRVLLSSFAIISMSPL